MGLNTRLTVGSVILFILLMSIFGVSRAFRSLTGTSSQDNRIESVDIFQDEDDSAASDRISTRERTRAQVTDARTRNEDGELVLNPLQEAGTFIQRQKRIEEDPTVAGTEVAVLSVSNGTTSSGTSTTAVQPNTITNTTQPSNPEPTTSATRSRVTSAPATAPAVPALW